MSPWAEVDSPGRPEPTSAHNTRHPAPSAQPHTHRPDARHRTDHQPPNHTQQTGSLNAHRTHHNTNSATPTASKHRSVITDRTRHTNTPTTPGDPYDTPTTDATGWILRYTDSTHTRRSRTTEPRSHSTSPHQLSRTHQPNQSPIRRSRAAPALRTTARRPHNMSPHATPAQPHLPAERQSPIRRSQVTPAEPPNAQHIATRHTGSAALTSRTPVTDTTVAGHTSALRTTARRPHNISPHTTPAQPHLPAEHRSPIRQSRDAPGLWATERRSHSTSPHAKPPRPYSLRQYDSGHRCDCRGLERPGCRTALGRPTRCPRGGECWSRATRCRRSGRLCRSGRLSWPSGGVSPGWQSLVAFRGGKLCSGSATAVSGADHLRRGRGPAEPGGPACPAMRRPTECRVRSPAACSSARPRSGSMGRLIQSGANPRSCDSDAGE
ncbi:hypothetical protein NRB20_38430 [Nocardia sp. RB20]|uniref:Uncharacterized protein n=1 Tax=Nocardia macrotermitis TaxID=2585198 RepID=A0A7K0D4Q3_9NOCA|nr:hypothetical protein [Nocardia macrotermitis]